MRLRLLLLAAFWLAPLVGRQASAAPADADTNTLRVFIFAGQSNMVGSDSHAKDIDRFPPFAGLAQPQNAVLFSYHLGREEKRTSQGWVALQPVDGVVGPELSFARRVAAETQAPIAIIKCAAGGTTLGGDWNPDEPTGFKLYPLALQWIQSSLAELDRRKIAYRIEGFMWHQGENDMFSNEFRPNYGRNLKRFLECWRRDLKTPALKFYLGELCTKTIWGMDNREPMYAIRTGQKAVAESDPLAEYIPTSHIGIEIGGGEGLHYHYGTLGQLEHGVNYADAYLRTIGKRTVANRELKDWPYKKGSPVKLFILAGHRNMEGERAFTQDLRSLAGQETLANDNAAIAFRYSLGGGYRISNGWEPLGPTGFYDTFGPELSFGRTLQGKEPGNIAVAKFTHSGSQMNDWTPQGTSAKERNLYPAFIAFIQDAMKDLQGRGHPVELAGIFYHVGENDMSFHPYRRQAVPWLRATITRSREDLGLPGLPWFVSQQPPTDEKGLNQVDVTAQLAALAAADPAVSHLKAFQLPPEREQLVITTAGIVQLGTLLAEQYLASKGSVPRAAGNAPAPAPTPVLRQTRNVSGWQVHLHARLLETESVATERAMVLLQGMLDEIVRQVPARAVAELQKVPLYFSPAYRPGQSGAEYHPGADWLRDNGRDPGMARGVEFSGVHDFEAEVKRMPNFALHELAHAYHDRVLAGGFGHAGIRAAYERAKASGSYDRVERWLGTRPSKTPEKAYAITNPMEYFAEGTEAYFSRNDFYPFTREELQRHDPELFKLLEQLWNRPAPASGSGQVLPPPPELKLPAFYQKYVSAEGYPIVASARVNDYALREAAYLVNLLLAKRPDVRAAMIQSGSRLCIIAHDEFTTDLPEWARMRPKDWWDARARGTGGSADDPYCSCGEENLLSYSGDPYVAENILIHEFAHNIHLRGMVNVDPTFDERVKATYDSAMKAGLWKGKYASVNHHEYFAEGVQSWFDNNRVNDHDHNHVNTRALLLEYDPGLAALCREVFGDTVVKYTKPVTRLRDHLEGYDPATAPKFVWPERLKQVRTEIKQQAQARSDSAESGKSGSAK
jgi:hypothetical protein